MLALGIGRMSSGFCLYPCQSVLCHLRMDIACCSTVAVDVSFLNKVGSGVCLNTLEPTRA